jgi:tetratricopeptide (TPR) repeat protein
MSNHLDYEINKELGECYLHMGDLEKAEEYYQKAAGSNGSHADPYMGLATIAVQRGDLDKAMSLYEKAASIDADDKPLTGMALVLMENGDHTGAYEKFTMALNVNPENLIALFCLVQIGHVLEKLSDVVPYLRNYLAVDPVKHEVRYALAGCLTGLGQKDEAKVELEYILRNDPGNKDAGELLEQIS